MYSKTIIVLLASMVTRASMGLIVLVCTRFTCSSLWNVFASSLKKIQEKKKKIKAIKEKETEIRLRNQAGN